jgi:type I site-specific restriction endonuclease|tara:strand:- start:632 stop:1450 length:819 start_codon:yes stop_codon:yes gene_type:complete
MQEKLLYAYEEKSKGAKTLIFNNGINTSKAVYEMFLEEGYEIRHLDNTHSEKERADILKWFKEKPDAILSSVSILTTGFDEPTVDTIILNRATKSLTLFHQMIGRGSRILNNKKNFTVIDLGNNARRFGLWESHVDWQQIFKTPNTYLEGLYSDEEIERQFVYVLSDDIKAKFPKTTFEKFEIKDEYKKSMDLGERPIEAIYRSIACHKKMILENTEDVFDALELAELLEKEVQYRVKRFSYCIAKSTKNYLDWMQEDYMRKLKQQLRQELN